jgi:uncharacterized RDD family membrane protein YckC
MGQNWFYAQGSNQVGPVAAEQLRAMLADGRLSSSALVWSEGMAAWTAAQAVPEFAGAVPISVGAAVAAIPYYTPQVQYQYAGFWLRFVAAFIDGLILAVVGFVIGGVIGFALGSAGADQRAIGLLAQLAGVAVNWLYFALQESGPHQATVGKRALSLRVTDISGQRLTFGRASGRFFGKYISMLTLFIGYMMAGWTQRKQALHDIMANCLVLRTA